MNRIVSYASTDTTLTLERGNNDIAAAAAVLRQYPMSRYARLLDEDFDTTADEPSSSSTTLSPPPSSAFFLNGTNSNSITNNRSNNIHNTNSTQRMSNMLASLKESAANASGSLRENMGKASNSVRLGLGLPSGSADNNNIINNADESDAMTEASGSSSSQVLEEISEYCPKLTYQQVRNELTKCKYILIVLCKNSI